MIQISLLFGLGRLAVEWDTFHPQFQSLPVDTKNNTHCQQRKPNAIPGESRVGEFLALAANPTDQSCDAVLNVVDVDLDLFFGNFYPEIKFRIEAGIGRNVKILWRAQVKGRVCRFLLLFRDQPGLEFSEGVADLDDHTARRALMV